MRISLPLMSHLTANPRINITESNHNLSDLVHSANFKSQGGKGGRGSSGGSIPCQVCKKYRHEMSICYHRFNSPLPRGQLRDESQAYSTPSCPTQSTPHTNVLPLHASLSASALTLLSFEHIWSSISCPIPLHVTPCYTSVHNA